MYKFPAKYLRILISWGLSVKCPLYDLQVICRVVISDQCCLVEKEVTLSRGVQWLEACVSIYKKLDIS